MTGRLDGIECRPSFQRMHPFYRPWPTRLPWRRPGWWFASTSAPRPRSQDDGIGLNGDDGWCPGRGTKHRRPRARDGRAGVESSRWPGCWALGDAGVLTGIGRERPLDLLPGGVFGVEDLLEECPPSNQGVVAIVFFSNSTPIRIKSRMLTGFDDDGPDDPHRTHRRLTARCPERDSCLRGWFCPKWQPRRLAPSWWRSPLVAFW